MENNYSNYQSMVTTVTTGISKLDSVYRQLSMDAQADELSKVSNCLQNHIFSVGIMGEFKRGKSTVINALLGSQIVPADIRPTSATLNYIKWDTEKRAVVKFKNGKTKDVPVDEISDYITKLTDESEAQAKEVDSATVYYPCAFCQNGVQIIDTPGLNDDERMNEISESVLPTLDAIIMVIVPDAPFGMSEAEFVRNKVMTSDLGRIIFVVNKIDKVDEDERELILDHIKQKIKSSVLEKIEAMYGKDSTEYNSAKEKLSGIRVYGISAKQALKAKMKGDTALLKESGFEDFELALSQLLTEERGTLELIHPVNQMISTASTSLDMIENRMNALELEEEEFQKIYEDATAKIKETRDKKKAEMQQLKSKGKTLYVDLLPEVAPAYDEMYNSFVSNVNQIDISEDIISQISTEQDIKDFCEQYINPKLQKATEDALSTTTEKLLISINRSLERDVTQLEKFGEEFNATVSSINLNMSQNSSSPSGNMKSVLVNTVIDGAVMLGSVSLLDTVIPGIGGLVAGFREHGIKGAAVGGLSGAVLGVGALTLAAGPLGLVGLPVVLIGSLASTVGGKFVTNLIFGSSKKKPENKVSVDFFREQLTVAAEQTFQEVKNGQTIESWLKNTCANVYADMAADIDQQWENTLITLERNLAQIQSDIKVGELKQDEIKKDMEEYANIVKDVIADVQPIREKLTAALA